MNKILSISEYEDIEKELTSINVYVNQFEEEINEVLNIFNNDPVVQEFYASGNYGKNIKERIQQIKKVIEDYIISISRDDNSLINQTKKYIYNQKDLLLSSSRENTRTESTQKRMDGNI